MTDLKITFELPINTKKDTLQVIYEYLDNLKHYEDGKIKHNVFENFSRPSPSKKTDDGYSYSSISLTFVDINFLDSKIDIRDDFKVKIETTIRKLIENILQDEYKSLLLPDFNVYYDWIFL